MRWLLPLLAASLLTLAVSLSPYGLASARVAAGPPAQVECERPGTLRLRRFEDRSARLECAGRALVRVSVPG